MGFSLLQGFSHIELTKRRYQLYVVSFSPYFPTGFEGVLTTYHTLLLTFFPQDFWRRLNQDDEHLQGQP